MLLAQGSYLWSSSNAVDYYATNTADYGAGSLRDVIELANQNRILRVESGNVVVEDWKIADGKAPSDLDRDVLHGGLGSFRIQYGRGSRLFAGYDAQYNTNQVLHVGSGGLEFAY